MFLFTEILACVGGTTSSYMGTGSPDAEVGDDFFLCTTNPVSTPHVYTTAMAVSRDMTTPTTPAVFRASRTSDDVAIAIIIITTERVLIIKLLARKHTYCAECCDICL